jgi:DNA-binding NtrC family response regulator
MRTSEFVICIIDDDRTFLQIASRKIEKEMNCKVLTYESAEEFFRKVPSKPHLVLTDYHLHSSYEYKMNGGDLARSIQESYKDVPVVVFSSKRNAYLMNDCKDADIFGFLQKDEKIVSKMMARIRRVYQRYRLATYRKVQTKEMMKEVYKFLAVLASMMILFFVYPPALPYYIIVLFIFGVYRGLRTGFASVLR